jgi:glucuronoarabinoxylan endo-1,4-beta-xylanase
MSTDIVATDYTGRKLLADYRGPDGQYCETINIATHIDTAANLIYGLGTNNPAEMDVVYVMNQAGVEHDPDQTGVPHEAQLDQNYPNPFNPSTTIPYKVKMPGHVVLKVFDIKGREVATLVNGFQQAGSHSVKFFGTNLASGVYVCRLQTEGSIQSRKIVFMK